jgi:hypothetical protein
MKTPHPGSERRPHHARGHLRSRRTRRGSRPRRWNTTPAADGAVLRSVAPAVPARPSPTSGSHRSTSPPTSLVFETQTEFDGKRHARATTLADNHGSSPDPEPLVTGVPDRGNRTITSSHNRGAGCAGGSHSPQAVARRAREPLALTKLRTRWQFLPPAKPSGVAADEKVTVGDALLEAERRALRHRSVPAAPVDDACRWAQDFTARRVRSKVVAYVRCRDGLSRQSGRVMRPSTDCPRTERSRTIRVDMR